MNDVQGCERECGRADGPAFLEGVTEIRDWDSEDIVVGCRVRTELTTARESGSVVIIVPSTSHHVSRPAVEHLPGATLIPVSVTNSIGDVGYLGNGASSSFIMRLFNVTLP